MILFTAIPGHFPSLESLDLVGWHPVTHFNNHWVSMKTAHLVEYWYKKLLKDLLF